MPKRGNVRIASIFNSIVNSYKFIENSVVISYKLQFKMLYIKSAHSLTIFIAELEIYINTVL